METFSLSFLGWNTFFESQYQRFEPDFPCTVGRVIAENKTNYLVASHAGELLAENSGKLLFTTDDASLLPKVGDWVYLHVYDAGHAIIHNVFSRRTVLSRTHSGKTHNAQVIVANLDLLFIVQALDQPLNVRRIERFIALTDGTGIKPVVILNKTDCCSNWSEEIARVRREIPSVEALGVNIYEPERLDALQSMIPAGITAAFLGSSGVGKSSLINRLCGSERQSVHAVRSSDAKGRHTTTRRELFLLPHGGMVVDTPGLREIQLPLQDDDTLGGAFADIAELVTLCQFRDCSHTTEKGCAVLAALENGEISQGHLHNYQKLRREQAYRQMLADPKEQRRKKDMLKRRHKEYNAIVRRKRNLF